MMKKVLLISLLAIGLSLSVQAQEDIQFSQFNSAPLNINPGEAGMFDGNVRAFAHYRTQWAGITTPFKTFAASVDLKLLENTFNGSFLGVGVNFFNDKAGDSHFTMSKYNLTVSYALDIEGDGSNYIALGLQGGYLQRSIDMSNLTWGAQYTGVDFDQSLPSHEATGKQSESMPDVGAGIYWKDKFSNDNSVFLGVSSFHLTSPSINFIEGNKDDEYIRKYTIVAGAEIKLGHTENVWLLPNVLYTFQGPNQIFNFGTELKFVLNDKIENSRYGSSIQVGAYCRYGDAVYGTVRLNWTNWSAGFVYDMNVMSMSEFRGGRSAMEIMVSYIGAFSNSKSNDNSKIK